MSIETRTARIARGELGAFGYVVELAGVTGNTVRVILPDALTFAPRQPIAEDAESLGGSLPADDIARRQDRRQ
jgi:hypothetical protein